MRHEELDEAIETDNNLIKAIEKDDDQEQVDNSPKVKRSLVHWRQVRDTYIEFDGFRNTPGV